MGTTTEAGSHDVAHPAGNPAPGRARGGVVLAFAVAFAAGFSFVFHAGASRLLQPNDYGGLAAVLALMVAAVVPISAVQAAVTRTVAEAVASGAGASGRRLLGQACGAAIATLLASTAAAPLITALTKLPNRGPALLMAVWLAINVPEAVVKGLLVGAGQLRGVAMAIITGAFLRVGCLAALAAAQGWSAGPGSAMAATVLAEAAMVALLARSAWRAGLLHATGTRLAASWGDAGRALNCQLALWMYSAAAAVLARHLLGTGSTGPFAAMVTAAGACIFLPQAVATVAFPRFVADNGPSLLLRALAVAGGVSLLCGLCLLARPQLLFGLLFGAEYRPDRATLALLVAHFAALGCLSVVAQHLVAGRRGGSWAFWAALAGGAGLAMAFGGTERSFAATLAAGSVTAATVFVARAARDLRALTAAATGHRAPAPCPVAAPPLVAARSISFTEPPQRLTRPYEFPASGLVVPGAQP